MAKLPLDDPKKLLAALKKSGDGADLTGASLAKQKLSGLSLHGAKLVNADLRGAVLHECTTIKASFANANLTGAKLTSCSASDASYIGAKLVDCAIGDTSLDRCDFTGADAAGLVLHDGSAARKAKFKKTNLRGARWSGVDLSGADLSEADLSGAKLVGVDLTGAKLVGTKLDGIEYDMATKWPGKPPARAAASADSTSPPPSEPSKPSKPAAAPRDGVLGEIGSFGDPLLLCDIELAHAWRGASDQAQYAALCDAANEAEGAIIALGAGKAAAWLMEGEGTAYVFQIGPAELLIVRAWMNDDVFEDERPAAIELAKLAAKKPGKLGKLSVESGTLCVLASANDGAPALGKRPPVPPAELQPDGDSIGIVVSLPAGTYELLTETVKGRAGSARRCRIRRA